MAFYKEVLGFHQIARPGFKSTGAWMASGSLEIHLTINPDAHMRPAARIDTADTHFAARVEDFGALVNHLEALGYSGEHPDGDLRRLIFRLNGPAPYKQLYMLDPDNHLIEINDAVLKSA